MEKMGIKKIEASTEAIKIQFIPKPHIDSMKIIQLIQKDRFVKLSGPDRLRISPNPANGFQLLEQRTFALKKLLAYLS